MKMEIKIALIFSFFQGGKKNGGGGELKLHLK